jgi:hypothetical protein
MSRPHFLGRMDSYDVAVNICPALPIVDVVVQLIAAGANVHVGCSEVGVYTRLLLLSST